MLEKLFAGKNAAPAPASAPAGLRLYAIGDIHGCLDRLDALLAAIAAEPGDAEKRLIFLGDYVDRGPDSRGVIERLLAVAAAAPLTVFLKGNHEAAMLGFLSHPDDNDAWLDWGGADTVRSYGIDPATVPGALRLGAALETAMPPAHAAFLRALKLTATFGDYLFVHAGVKPGVALDAQSEDDLLWIRGEFHNAAAGLRPDKVIVHGHHPLRKPLDAGWRIDVDTGACFGGKLTAAVLEGTSRRFLSA